MSVGAQVTQHTESPRDGDALPAVGTFRLVLGLAQGVALYLLERQREAHGWPATDPYIFVPLFSVSLIVPIFVLQAAGGMRRVVLVAWAIVASAVVASLGWYDAWRQAPDLLARSDGLPTLAFVFFASVGLFIVQSLIAAGDANSSLLTRYRDYFDSTWKFGVQLALTVAFVIAFWLLLYLGADLFQLIKLGFLRQLIQHSWFYFPAISIAAAAAIHLTDVRAQMVVGIRTVGLTLLSWLLPLLTLLVGGFVISLGFTGLEPLWRTRAGVAILLISAGVLVVLINAVYQDGDGARPIVLRYSEILASVLLIPLVTLSAYALALRVQQYGWTIERIGTLACVLVAACYALGYTAAALFSLLGGQWMWALESVNIFVAFLILVLLGLLFSPAGDPAKLSVASQMARIQDGATKVSAFDFTYLRSKGGRYGLDTLRNLAATYVGNNAKAVRGSAIAALKLPPLYVRPPRHVRLADRIRVHPSGKNLPQSFLKQDWASIAFGSSEEVVPTCLWSEYAKCDVFLVDVDADGQDEVVVFDGSIGETTAPLLSSGEAFKLDKNGSWVPIASIPGTICGAAAREMLAGKFVTAPPDSHARDLVVGAQHFSIVPMVSRDACTPGAPYGVVDVVR